MSHVLSLHEPPNPDFLPPRSRPSSAPARSRWRGFGSDVRVDKKGAIDLVTEVDLEVERMFRALIGERFPDHDVLAEEMGQTRDSGATLPLGLRSARRHDQLRARHPDLLFDAWRSKSTARRSLARSSIPTARELFTAERGVGAWLNGEPLHVSTPRRSSMRCWSPAFRTTSASRMDDILGCSAASCSEARAVRRLGSAAIDLCWVAAGRMDGFWEQGLQAWDTMAGALIVQEAGGRVTALDGGPWDAARRTLPGLERPDPRRMVAVSDV